MNIPKLSLSPTELMVLRESQMETIYIRQCDLATLPGVQTKDFRAFEAVFLEIYPHMSKYPEITKGIFHGLIQKHDEKLVIQINGEYSRDTLVGGWMAVETQPISQYGNPIKQ